MSAPGEGIPRAAIVAGVTPAFTQFLYKGGYDFVAEQSATQYANGNEEALFIPAVKLLVDATLGIVRQPAVEEYFDTVEVHHRAYVGATEAARVTSIAIANSMLIGFYAGNKHLQPLLDESTIGVLSNQTYLERLAQAPFYDVSRIGGGALRVINLAPGMLDRPGLVIGRSSGLLAIAGLGKDRADASYRSLGYPYIHAHLLEPGVNEAGQVVDFTSEGRQLVRQFYREGSGCPTHNMNASPDSNIPLLEEYLSQLSDYLIPEGATAELAHHEAA